MSVQIRLLLVLGCLSCLSSAPPMLAQAQDGAVSAETALARGAYAQARALAQTTIQNGTSTVTELVAPYRVLAIASAYQDDVETSTRAFTTLLALDPGFRLPEGLPPEVRSPYMNARGFWSVHNERLSVQVELGRDPSDLGLHIQDPAGLTSRIRVRARAAGKASFIEVVRAPAPELTVTIAGIADASAVEYNVALLDEHGNRIWQTGTDGAPQRLVRPTPLEVETPLATKAPAVAPAEPAVAAEPPAKRRRPYLVVGSSLVVLGALSAAAGGYAHRRHEQVAERWNSGDCGGSGTTRGMICAAENREMKDMTRLATILYGAGAAALVTGAVVLILAPNRSRERAPNAAAFGCDQGPGTFGVACTRRF